MKKYQVFQITADWMLETPLWFSASGSTQVIIAEIINKHFSIDIQEAIDRIVDPIAVCHNGFIWDGWENGFVADAKGFDRYLTRQGF